MPVEPITSVLERLHASEDGLTSAEAKRRVLQHGPNDLATRSAAGSLRQLVLLFGNPLVLILLLASFVAAFLGEIFSSSIIVVIVLMGLAIDFFQTSRSQRVVEKLRATVTPTTTVRRDGVWQELARREVVPGDVIRLTAGDLVPADARLLEARDLHVQEGALTGESMPVEKSSDGDPSATDPRAERSGLVFLGTSVISGTGIAVVVSTGRHTAFGDIASRLATRPPETEFERGTREFSLFILKAVFFLVLFVFVMNIGLRRDPLQSLLFAVALAVGLTPEFLPMIVAVTLAEGAVHMARRKVIVKHLPAMQNFGSMDILCSDKTGTLTRGEMQMEGLYEPFGEAHQQAFFPAYLNSVHETGIHSPLDTAILAAGKPDVSAWRKVDEIPFDFERRRLSVVVESGGERWLITKGAPEAVIPCCAFLETSGKQLQLDAESRKRCESAYQSLGGKGLRVLAVARRKPPEQTAFYASDEQGMSLLGFLAFSDPPRADATDVLKDLRNDGVHVKILTGDNELVAAHVANLVGLNASRVVLGDEIDRISDSALGHVAERATVFARVSPAQKNRILLALKHRGHVVGFLGDGINDAPSLHAADVGISVSSAADVAKDAAEIILQEPDLRALHLGILEGRKAFGNVVKYLLMGTSSNFGNMFSMAAASVFLPFLPMLPLQVLLNSFLYDFAQLAIPTDNVDATFTRKPRRWDIALVRRFMLVLGPLSSVFDIVTFWALLTWFRGSEAHFHTGWFIESLATQTLVLFVIRTAGNPLRSRPSRLLTLSVCTVVAAGIALPFTPLANDLGFTPMSALFFVFLVGVVGSYLGLTEVIKWRLMRRFTD